MMSMLFRSPSQTRQMLKTLSIIAAGTTCIVLGTNHPVQAATIVDSVNANSSPAAFTSWGATEVGWFYTPTSSYTLDGINTKFGSGGSTSNQTVTVEVYNGAPSSATLLRSASFTALINQFSGGTFANLNLLAGQSYFIGFRNVGGLGVNFTNDVGATALAPFQFGFSNNGSYTFGSSNRPNTQAILQFSQNSAPIPTPALLPGLLALGLGVLRKRKANQVETALEE
jgi:hypothetical protein